MKIINQKDQYKENENDGITILNFINGYELGIYDSINSIEEIKMFFPSIFITEEINIENIKINLDKIFIFFVELVKKDRRTENLKMRIGTYCKGEDFTNVPIIELRDFENREIISILFIKNYYRVDCEFSTYWIMFEDELYDYNIFWWNREDDVSEECKNKKITKKELLDELCHLFKNKVFDFLNDVNNPKLNILNESIGSNERMGPDGIIYTDNKYHFKNFSD